MPSDARILIHAYENVHHLREVRLFFDNELVLDSGMDQCKERARELRDQTGEPVWLIELSFEARIWLPKKTPKPAVKAEPFLINLYATIRAKKHEAATDLVYDQFRELLSSIPQDIVECDRILFRVKCFMINSTIMRGILTATFRDRKLFQHRADFYERAFKYIAADRDEETADRLLGRLR